MDFAEFLKCIPKIVKETLPAEDAHVKMAPPERKAILQKLNHETTNAKNAAVMMLFYPRNGQTNLVLILRNSYKGVHSSQVAFPGGKIEPEDGSYEQTALRETHEEIGIAPGQLTVVRAFSQLYIPPSNFMVFPFMAYSNEELIFAPDPREVAGLIEVSLDDFLDDSIVINNRMATSYSPSIDVPGFKIGEHVVWGATAMIMSELKEVLKRVL